MATVPLSPVVTFSHYTELPIEALLGYLHGIKVGEKLYESVLQGAIFNVTTLAMGRIVSSFPDGYLRVQQTSDLATLLVGPDTAAFHDQRLPRVLIKWRDEVKAIQRNAMPAKRKRRGSRAQSDRTGIRIPDVVIAYLSDKPNPKHIVLHVIELKIWNSPTETDKDNTEKTEQWRRGMSQTIIYLAQCFEHCGTFLGTFVLRTQFTRLVVDEGLQVLVEVKQARDAQEGRSISIPAFLDCKPSFSNSLPYDLFPDPSLGEDDGVPPAVFRKLWDHLSLAREIVGSWRVDKVPDDVSWFGMGGRMRDCNLAPNTTRVHDLEAVLALAATAYPEDYPSWWVDAKTALIREGRPEALVSPYRCCSRMRRSREDSESDSTPPDSDVEDCDTSATSWSSDGFSSDGFSFSDDESDAELSDEDMERLLAQLALGGWRIRLVTPGEMDAAVRRAMGGVRAA